MSYTKKMICLANSKKLSGRCIAGKEIGKTSGGKWIRPVSTSPTCELSFSDIRYENGSYPQVLDIIEILMVKAEPHHTYQTENHVIDNKAHWKKIGIHSKANLLSLCDSTKTLWINGYNSSNGLNDRIPLLNATNDVSTSLLMIKPEEIYLSIGREFNKKKFRAHFKYNGIDYCFGVTDLEIESKYKNHLDGQYYLSADHCFLCISLSEPYKGYCYKLVAAIIFDN